MFFGDLALARAVLIPSGMGNKDNCSATAVMTVAGLALLLAVMGSVAFVTRAEPLVSEPSGTAGVGERLGRR